MRDDRERLLDILEAVGNIERRMPESREAFLGDEMVQVWMVYHITVLGEAASGLSEGLKARFVDVPWADVIAMRNVLVHQYFGIDPEEVWSTVKKDIPRLKSEVTGMIAALGPAR